MNERIEHITKQVDEYFDDLTIEFSREAWQTKFAELIVRECAKALDDKLANPNGASVAYCDGSDLLEHFGVEE